MRPKLEVLPGGNNTPEKPFFAVDIDNTLYDFEAVARDAFLELSGTTRDIRRGAYLVWDEWRSPADACGLETWMEVIHMCHQPGVILAQTPFRGAVETIRALHERGYGIMYVSNRSPESAEATREWLDDSGFPMHDHIEVHCMMEDKGPYLARCQYIIDDRPKTLLDFVYDHKWKGEPREGFSLLYPYNRALTDIPSLFLAPTWAGLNDRLIRHGLLPDPTLLAA